MSDLPPQDAKMYTESEVNHLVAREVAKQRISDLERQIGAMKNDHSKGFAQMEAKLDALGRTMEMQHQQLRESYHSEQVSLKDQIAKDYATKLDLAALDNKVDKLWLKITLPVGTITLLANWLFSFLSKIPTIPQ